MTTVGAEQSFMGCQITAGAYVPGRGRAPPPPPRVLIQVGHVLLLLCLRPLASIRYFVSLTYLENGTPDEQESWHFALFHKVFGTLNAPYSTRAAFQRFPEIEAEYEVSDTGRFVAYGSPRLQSKYSQETAVHILSPYNSSLGLLSLLCCLLAS